MTIHMAVRYITKAAFFLAVLSTSSSLLAQDRVTIPGSAFSPLAQGTGVVIEDVAGGRSFRGQAFSHFIITADLTAPPSRDLDYRLQKLIIHFRTSPLGPSLLSLELNKSFKFVYDTPLTGTTPQRK